MRPPSQRYLENLIRRSAAARSVASRHKGFVPAALREELEAVATALRGAPATAARLAMQEALDDERIAVLQQRVDRRRSVLLGIRESIARLRDLPSRSAIIEAAPAEACRSCGLARCLLSRIDGTAWVPEILWTTSPESEPADFRQWLQDARIPLEHMMLETEMVRRGRPALVHRARDDERTHKAIILASGAGSYCAAPIVPGRRAVGFLHCDRLDEDQPLTDEDRDNLGTFAEQLAVVLEGAALRERLAAVEFAARRTADGLIHDVHALRAGPVALGEQRLGMSTASSRSAEVQVSRLLQALTARERQVLEHLATGASNREIADALVITEGTVKTHVRRILRKLRVENRAQAVARHLQAAQKSGDLG